MWQIWTVLQSSVKRFDNKAIDITHWSRKWKDLRIALIKGWEDLWHWRDPHTPQQCRSCPQVNQDQYGVDLNVKKLWIFCPQVYHDKHGIWNLSDSTNKSCIHSGDCRTDDHYFLDKCHWTTYVDQSEFFAVLEANLIATSRLLFPCWGKEPSLGIRLKIILGNYCAWFFGRLK